MVKYNGVNKKMSDNKTEKLKKACIPKTINYFWFGKSEMPDIFYKCIASWKKYCPDYEIKRWDESNFDISISNYMLEAYSQKKYAFVSDYARFYILEKYGGIYLDVDVELLKNIDDLLSLDAFTGIENNSNLVAPGLILASQPHNKFCKEMLKFYDENGYKKLASETICTISTRILREQFYFNNKNINEIQNLDGITIYPSQFFCAYDMILKKKEITDETYSIHHYNASWLGGKDQFKNLIRRITYRALGKEKYNKLKAIVKGNKI